MTPDVIGARLGQVFDVAPADMSSVLVSSSLTATTAFGASVTAAGAVGGLLVLAALAVICVLTVIMLRRSPMREEGLAILATVVFFSFFENMLTYTGLIGQLAFPLLAAAVALVRHGRREPDLNPGLVQSSFKTTV
jgi:Ca2+/Na+ antiporter